MSSTLKESSIGGVYVGKGPGSASSNLIMGNISLGSGGSSSSSNVIIGNKAGSSITNTVTNSANVIIGGNAAKNTNTVKASVIIGYDAGRYCSHTCSVVVGLCASRSNCSCNSVIIGNHAGAVTSNSHNSSVILGNFSSRCRAACNSVVIGYKAGCSSGDYWYRSVLIGTEAAYNAYPDPRSVIFIGKNTQSHGKYAIGIGNYTRSGTQSVVIGHGASGLYSGNLVVGYNAAVYADYEGVWGNSSNNTKNCIWPNWTFLSDCRDKADVTPLTENYGVPLLKKLKPASFKWDNRQTYVREKGMQFGDKDGSFVSEHTNYGFIAQDIKASADELNIKIPGLETESETYKLPYETFIFTSIESIKQMLTRIESLEEELTLLETQ